MRGNARYRIRARSKEEAIEIARQRFEHEAFDERQSFLRSGVAERIRSVVGFEAERVDETKTPRKLLLEWKNKPDQPFATGTDKHPAHPRPKKKTEQKKGQRRLP